MSGSSQKVDNNIDKIQQSLKAKFVKRMTVTRKYFKFLFLNV